jgi:outer membrane protein W
MQKFFTAIISLLFFYNTSYSQIQKGSFVVSGGTDVNLLFSNIDQGMEDAIDNDVKLKDYSFNAGFGYFIIDDLAVNIAASYQYSYYKKQIYLGPVYEEDIQSAISLIPSVTYFFPVEGKLKPNVSLGAGYVALKERNNQQSTSDNVVYHYGGLSLNAGAGVSLFLNRNVSFDLGLQYSRNKLNDKAGDNRSQLQNIFGVMAGVSVYF